MTMNLRSMQKVSSCSLMAWALILAGCVSKQAEYYTPYEPDGWTISREPLDDYLKQPFKWGIYPNNEALVLNNETTELALALWPQSRLAYLGMTRDLPLLLRMNVRARQNVEIACDKVFISIPSNAVEKVSPKAVEINGTKSELNTLLHLPTGEEALLQLSYYPGKFRNKQVFYLLIEGISTNGSAMSIPVIRLNHVDELSW